jgi:DNA primase
MLWSREIEGGSFATPERRAALEARIGELSNGIRDEVVRRYYRQDLAERLQRAFAPEGGRGGYGKGNFRGGQGAANHPAVLPPAAASTRARPADSAARAGAGRGRAGRCDFVRPLPGGQRPARDQPDHARPAQRHLPPRGADSGSP